MIFFVTLLALCSVAFADDSGSDIQTRVKGGVTAAPGEFKYQASVRINGEHVCGGALITNRHVVTSASCLVNIFRNPSLLEHTQVVIGTISITRDGYYFGVSRVSIHPQYEYNREWSSYVNDIGVIHLNGRAPEDRKWVEPINLPGVTELPQNAELLFIGWGAVANNVGPTVDLLQKVKLRYIDTQECQRYFRDLQVKQYQLCTAASYNVGTCTTDSGSPVVYNNQLIGINTKLQGCAHGTPDVFTKVSYYLKYILDEVNYPNKV